MGILEDIYERLGNIENALAGGAAAGSSDKPAAKPKAAGGKKVKEADVTALVQKLAQVDSNKAKIKALFATFGFGRLGEAKEEQYPGILAGLQEIEAEAEAGDDDDDLLG